MATTIPLKPSKKRTTFETLSIVLSFPVVLMALDKLSAMIATNKQTNDNNINIM